MASPSCGVFTNSAVFNQAIEEYKNSPYETEVKYGQIDAWNVMSLSWNDIHKHMCTAPAYKYIHADDDDISELVEMWIHLQSESDKEFTQHNEEPPLDRFKCARRFYDTQLNSDRFRWEVFRRQTLNNSVCGKRDVLKTSRSGWFTSSELVHLLSSNQYQAARKLSDVYWR